MGAPLIRDRRTALWLNVALWMASTALLYDQWQRRRG